MHERPMAITHAWNVRHAIGWTALATAVVLATGGYMISRFLPHPAAEQAASEQVHQGGSLADGWSYIPGVTPEADGLHVAYMGRSIVRQDGSPGQDNPAVNIYGTHLAGAGDATLRFTLKDIHGTANLRLYDDVPLVSDEFRREPDSVEISLGKQAVQVSRWHAYNGGSAYQQKPQNVQTASYPSASETVVSAQRQGSRWSIKVNDATVYTSQASDALSHDVWFGLSAPNPGDSWTLQSLNGQLASGAQLADAAKSPLPSVATDGLQQLARKKRPDFVVGAATALGPLVADPDYARLALAGNFGQLTTENVLKWQFVHPQPGVYDFREADALVALAQRAHMAVQGHTLVFGEANPAWVQQLPLTTSADKAHAGDVMIDHITQTVDHFRGRVASWDVVNEPMADYGTAAGANGLRQHIWYKVLGADYIAAAFRAAHTADPAAKLFINDFGLETDDSRWAQFLQLMTLLKAQGVPIDGVGFEAHVYEAGDKIDPAVLRSHIQQLARIGLMSRVSEMDVYNDDGATVQARQYADVFAACLAEPSCVSWSTWGVTDRYDVSLGDKAQIQYGNDLLWDKNAQPTPAVAAIKGVIGR